MRFGQRAAWGKPGIDLGKGRCIERAASRSEANADDDPPPPGGLRVVQRIGRAGNLLCDVCLVRPAEWYAVDAATDRALCPDCFIEAVTPGRMAAK